MGASADFRAFAGLDSWTGFGTALARDNCPPASSDCGAVNDWDAVNDRTNCSHVHEPCIPSRAAGGEHLPGGLGTSTREVGEDLFVGADGYDRHQPQPEM